MKKPITPLFKKIFEIVTGVEADVTKFDGGNAAAGVRVRKAMQALKVEAQNVRETSNLK